MESQQQQQERQEPQKDESVVTLFLTVEQGSYQPGSYITGTVHLYIPPSAMGCADFSGIHLRFCGQESLLGISQFTKKFLAIDTQLMKLPSTGLIPGQYEYPFYWKLPESLPCSMSCRHEDKKEDSQLPCELSYNLAAYLHPVNTSKQSMQEIFRVVNCVKPIKIKASTAMLSLTTSEKESHKSAPAEESCGVICKPQIRKIRSHFLNRGSIEIGLDTQQTDLSPNSVVNIGITGRNQSSIEIQYLKVKWTETMVWGLDGNCKRKNVLAERVVMLQDLPSWQAVTKKKRRTTTPNDNVDDDKINIRLQLKNVRDSYKGRWMKVFHTLKVTAVTEGRCVTNPTVKTIIEVRRQPNNRTLPVMATEATVIPQQPADKEATTTNLHGDAVLDGIEIPEAVPVLVNDPGMLPCEEEEEANQHNKNTKEGFCNSFSLLSQVCGGSNFSNLDQHPCAVQLKVLEPELVMTVQ